NPAQNRVYVTDNYLSKVTVLRDPPGAIEEATKARNIGTEATVVRGTYFLPGAVPADLVDAAGRVVAKLQKGNNNLGTLAPGVYFVRRAETSADLGRLVVTR
ncbi:MAG: hypothetical protein JSU73_00825, partial [candidate division WOR-3 bacterium]